MTERPKATEEGRVGAMLFGEKTPLEGLANEFFPPELRRKLGRYREARDELMNKIRERRSREGKRGPVILSKKAVGELLERFELKDILSTQAEASTESSDD